VRGQRFRTGRHAKAASELLHASNHVARSRTAGLEVPNSAGFLLARVTECEHCGEMASGFFPKKIGDREITLQKILGLEN
jgi:hypothetical protein